MNCHECGSTDHLVAHCPKRKGKGGKGKGKGKPRFMQGMFAQDHWFLDKTPRLQTDSEEGHWDHQAVDATINHQTHTSDAMNHFGSSVHIDELEDDDEYAHDEGATSSSKPSPERTSSLWNFPWWRIGATEEATENYLLKNSNEEPGGRQPCSSIPDHQTTCVVTNGPSECAQLQYELDVRTPRPVRCKIHLKWAESELELKLQRKR